MDTLFVSDLHLSTERPEKIELFRQFCNGPARSADAVYILGDLFENFWAGNDERTPPAEEVINVLRDCCRHNKHVYLMRGNRDLMLDHGFCVLTGCTLLGDETVIALYQGQEIPVISKVHGCSVYSALVSKPALPVTHFIIPWHATADKKIGRGKTAGDN